MSDSAPPSIRALVFDVFGTLVDWRTGVAAAVERHIKPLAAAVDPAAFADAWRGYYQPAMAPVRTGQRAWVDLDQLHSENLTRVLTDFGIPAIDQDTRNALVAAWHHLDPWPDVADALGHLRSTYLIAPLSNGHIALSIALARRSDLRWDAILGAELARNYKPAPVVYLSGVAALGLRPENVLMVACHSDDLAAARGCGLRTAHVARPDEKGPGRGEAGPGTEVDFAARDLGDLVGILRRDRSAA